MLQCNTFNTSRGWPLSLDCKTETVKLPLEKRHFAKAEVVEIARYFLAISERASLVFDFSSLTIGFKNLILVLDI